MDIAISMICAERPTFMKSAPGGQSYKTFFCINYIKIDVICGKI